MWTTWITPQATPVKAPQALLTIFLIHFVEVSVLYRNKHWLTKCYGSAKPSLSLLKIFLDVVFLATSFFKFDRCSG
jgi:hypothetical protein